MKCGGCVSPNRKFAGRGIKAAFWVAVFFVICGAAEGADLFRVEQQGDVYVGCEVVLSLAGKEAAISGSAYEWSFMGNAQAILLRKGGLECRFTPYDTKPITASAAAVGADGATLATAEITLSAKEFSVDIVQLEGEPFMLWDAAAKQDAPAEGIVAGQPVRFELKLAPEYKDRIQLQWDTDAATGIIEGGDGSRVTVVRSEIGEAELSAVVRGVNGIVLGRGRADFDVSVSRSKIDESNRRRTAWAQWIEAFSQWGEKKFDEALKNAEEAAKTDPDNPELADGVKAIRANHARVERARRFAAEAAALRDTEKLVDALKLYRRSYAAWPMEEAKNSIGVLEKEIDAARIKAQKMEWLRDVATSYDQENLFAEALGFYKELLALASDDSVAQRIDRIEKRLLSREQARIFIGEGRELEAKNQLQAALDKYKDSLKLETDAEVDGHARELEEAIKERKARAVSLRREAADFQKKKDNAQALLRYMESQELWPDAEADKQIAALRKIEKDPSSQDVRSSEDFGIGTRADAERFLRMGHDLYRDGKDWEALVLYRKSYAISEDGQLRDWIERVETPLKEYEAVQKANALIKDGNSLYNGGSFPEAIAKYKASLIVHPNAEVENFVAKLEDAMKKPTQSD
jgi:tetratricopeptide (TPR) repeat protein